MTGVTQFPGAQEWVPDRALAEAGIGPDETCVTNAVKHFRFLGRRGKQRIHQSPSRAHVLACQPWFTAELGVVRPRGVVILGGTAGKAVYGPGFKVGEQRGRLLEWLTSVPGVPVRPAWVLAAVHPSAVLRSREREETYAAFVADLRVAAEAMSGPGGAFGA